MSLQRRTKLGGNHLAAGSARGKWTTLLGKNVEPVMGVQCRLSEQRHMDLVKVHQEEHLGITNQVKGFLGYLVKVLKGFRTSQGPWTKEEPPDEEAAIKEGSMEVSKVHSEVMVEVSTFEDQEKALGGIKTSQEP